MSSSLPPHGLQHTRPPGPSPTPGVYSNSGSSSRWCHPTTSSSVVPFSSCLQSFPASGVFQWVSSSHQVGKVLEFQLQHQSFQWIFKTDFPQDGLIWSPCSPGDSQETPQFKKKKKLLGQASHHKMKWPLTKLALTQTLFLLKTNACLYRHSS